MALKGRQYTVTASAVQPLTAAFDSTLGHVPIEQISFKTPSTNTGTVYIGPSTVTAVPANAFIELPKGVGYTDGPFPIGSGQMYADDYYVVGTASDIVFIEVVLF